MSESLFKNTEEERALLNECMLNGNRVVVKLVLLAIAHLKPLDILEEFSSVRNRIIFKTILGQRKKGQPIDLITVTEQLHEQGKLEFVGGPQYLASIADMSFDNG